jgi:hypothetical protein
VMDDESPDNFDFQRSMRESIEEVFAEAQIVPLVVIFPDKVVAAIKAYEKEHGIDRERLFNVAMKAQRNDIDQLKQAMELFAEDPDSFEWPVENPLLCLLIGVIWKHAEHWKEKLIQEYGDEDDYQADWWKAKESE